MKNKNTPLRIKRNLLDEIDAIVEGRPINRSDFFGAAVSMLAENPQMARNSFSLDRVKQERSSNDDSLKLLNDVLQDRLMLLAVNSIFENGLTGVNTKIFVNGLQIEIKKGTLVRFKPPTTIEFEPTGDFRVQLDLVQGLKLKIDDAGRELPLSEKLINQLGAGYGLLFKYTT
ncbi:MAG: hypothetical protein PHO01_06260 [Desulfotomaculaceae bacterium]|nr:hypothetical protein [Desulfotomaculaceae bacterium]